MTGAAHYPGMVNSFPALEHVGLAGDWHAEGAWAVRAMNAAAAADISVILHVGDFGWWPRARQGRTYLADVNAACERRDIDLLVVAGNHEDWEMWNPGQQAFRRIHLLPRAGRMTVGQRTVAWMAGAASIDRDYRVEGVDWFPQELPTSADAALAAAGGNTDILLTHEAPITATAAVALGRIRNPMGLSEEMRVYSHAGAQVVEELANSVQPLLHAHGHWHMPESQSFGNHQSRRAGQVLSLGMNGQRQNLVKLNLADLSWAAISVRGEQ